MSEEKPKILVKKNGPLRVQGPEKLTDSRNEPIEIPEKLSLCRCGASNRKPFCDGTHRDTGFTDEKSGDRVKDKRHDFKGKDITIHDNRGICSHAGYCFGTRPRVFKQGKILWIDPDGDDRDLIVETIEMCPSGALSCSIDGVEHRDRESDPEIHVSRNGPYCVRGGVVIENLDGSAVDLGQGASTEHYTLCRCGQSKNQPRCDGSHLDSGFKDESGRGDFGR